MSARTDNLLLLTFARRGEEETIRYARHLLLRDFPGARTVAIGTRVSAPVISSAGVDDVILFDPARGGRQALRAAAGSAPKAAAIIYSDALPAAHLKLEALAFWSGAGRIYRCLPGGRAQIIGRSRLFFSIAAKTLLAVTSVAAGACVCAVAACYLMFAQATAGGNRARRT